jgi:hypothetical protein
MKNKITLHSDGLQRLIQANEPFWGGEAEVIRSYWKSPVRTPETDRKWLIHQIYKEYWDGILPPLELFRQSLPQASVKKGRDNLLTMAEVLYEEVEHFALFADLYHKLEDSDYALTPAELKEQGSWAENDDLMAMRQRHKEESPKLGLRAHRFTEGGYCALFTEGMALRGGGMTEDAIAEVCRRIYEDEFNHMLLGIIETDDAELTDSDWDTLIQYTVEQMKSRILMRNAQFSHPVSGQRLEDLLAGRADAVRFNFQIAEELLNRADDVNHVSGDHQQLA